MFLRLLVFTKTDRVSLRKEAEARENMSVVGLDQSCPLHEETGIGQTHKGIKS